MPSTTIFTLTSLLASSVAITIDVLAMANRVSHSLGRPSAFDVKIEAARAALFRPFLAFPEASQAEPDLFILPAQGLSKSGTGWRYTRKNGEP